MSRLKSKSKKFEGQLDILMAPLLPVEGKSW